GHSGNPGGRPRNPRTIAKRLAESIFDADAAALSRKAIELALAGDPISLRFCLSRIIAPSRENGIDVELPSVRGAADIAAAMTAVRFRGGTAAILSAWSRASSGRSICTMSSAASRTWRRRMMRSATARKAPLDDLAEGLLCVRSAEIQRRNSVRRKARMGA